jgi:hypothetical protein
VGEVCTGGAVVRADTQFAQQHTTTHLNPSMPEGPELRYMSEFITKHGRDGTRVYTRLTKSTLATNPRKHPDVPLPEEWNSRFCLRAVSRGKELRIILSSPDAPGE